MINERCLKRKGPRTWWHINNDPEESFSDPYFTSLTTDFQPSERFDMMDADEDLVVLSRKGYSVSIYRRDDDSTLWREDSVVSVPLDPGFGSSVAVSSEVDLIVVASASSEYLYIYDYDPILRQWFQALRFRPKDWKEGDRFGDNVIIKSSSRVNRILISAPGADGNKGKIYSYSFDRPDQMIDEKIYKSVQSSDDGMTGSQMDYDVETQTMIFTTQRQDSSLLNLIPNGDTARARVLTFEYGPVKTPSLYLIHRNNFWYFIFGYHNPKDQTRRINAIIGDEAFAQFRSVQSESISTLIHSHGEEPNEVMNDWLHATFFQNVKQEERLLVFMSNPTYTEQDQPRGAVFYVDMTDPFQMTLPTRLPMSEGSQDTYFGQGLQSTIYELLVSERQGTIPDSSKLVIYYTNNPAPHKPSNLFRSQKLEEKFGYPSPIKDIALNGHRLLIGRIGFIDVYYFDYDKSEWFRTFSVTAPESVKQKDKFGENIHYSETEDLLVVLLPGEIHLYDYEEGAGFQYACKFELPDAVADEEYSVCASGNKVFFGAPQRLTAKSKGVVYGYHYRTGCRMDSMVRYDMDVMQDALALNAEFGSDMAFDVPSQRLMVGAPGYGDRSVGGAVIHYPVITDPSQYSIQKGFTPEGRFGSCIDSVYHENVIYYMVGAPGAELKRGRAVACQLKLGNVEPACTVLSHDTFDYDGNYGSNVRVGVYVNKNSESVVAGFTSVANMYHPPSDNFDMFLRPYPKNDINAVNHFGGVAMYDLSAMSTIPRMYFSMVDEGREYAYGTLLDTGRFEVFIVGDMYETSDQIISSLESFQKPFPPTPPPVPRPSHGPTPAPTKRPTSAPFVDTSVQPFKVFSIFVGIFVMFSSFQFGTILYQRYVFKRKQVNTRRIA